MKNFLTFTLAAGVAITSTTVVHGAGLSKPIVDAERTVSRQSPAATANVGTGALDRASFNRELVRLSDLLIGQNSDDLVTEEVAVGRKSTGMYTF